MLFGWVKNLSHQRERELWIVHLDAATRIKGGARWNDQTGSATLLRSLEEFFIFDVGDVALARRIEAGNALNCDVTITQDAAFNALG